MSVSTWGRYGLYRLLKLSKGSKTFLYFNEFTRNQYKPFEQLAEWRFKRIEELLQDAFHHVPGYVERLYETCGSMSHGLDRAAFYRIPPLVRSDLVLNNTHFRHAREMMSPVFHTQTGGSTGAPVELIHSLDFRDWLQASSFFFNTWGGLALGKPYFMLWAAYQDLQPQMQNMKERLLMGTLQNRKILNCRVISPDLMAQFAHRIRDDRATRHMVAYANEAHALAVYCRENGLDMSGSLDAIYVTASTLTDVMRHEIEAVFHCRVYNRYGCRDAGEVAFSCPYQRGLHINPMYSLVEIADELGRPLPYGEEGQVLLTILHNRAMPLIRYAVGDMAILSPPERCACGREWETLTRVTGRVNEGLHLRGGARLGGGVLYTVFEHLPLLQRFQLCQLSEDMLYIRLRSHVPNYTEVYAEELERIGQRLYDLTGTQFSIEFVQTDVFERTATGKELFVLQKKTMYPELQLVS